VNCIGSVWCFVLILF